MRWYVSRDGQTSGPVEGEQVAAWARAGQLGPGTYVRDEAGSALVPFSFCLRARMRGCNVLAMDNRAAQALRTVFSKHGAQKETSDRTGIPASTLSRLANGQQPGRRHAAALLRSLGIELSWWDEPAEAEPSTSDATPTEAA